MSSLALQRQGPSFGYSNGINIADIEILNRPGLAHLVIRLNMSQGFTEDSCVSSRSGIGASGA